MAKKEEAKVTPEAKVKTAKVKVIAVACGECGEQMRNVGDGTSFCDNALCKMHDVRVVVGEYEAKIVKKK